MKRTFRKIKKTAAVLLLTLATVPATTAWAQTSGVTFKEAPLVQAEQMPAFEGGETAMMQYLATNIKYPKEAAKAGKSGMVVLQFVVEKDGTLSDIKTLKSAGDELDQEAIRVLKTTGGKWSPGKQNGEARRVQMTLPIKFMADKAAPDATGQLPAPPAPTSEVPGARLRNGSGLMAENFGLVDGKATAQYIGGPAALSQTIIKYFSLTPANAREAALDVTLQVKFTVEPDGSVSNIKPFAGSISNLSDVNQAPEAEGSNGQSKRNQLLEAANAAIKATAGNWEPLTVAGKNQASDMRLLARFEGSKHPSARPT